MREYQLPRVRHHQAMTLDAPKLDLHAHVSSIGLLDQRLRRANDGAQTLHNGQRWLHELLR